MLSASMRDWLKARHDRPRQSTSVRPCRQARSAPRAEAAESSSDASSPFANERQMKGIVRQSSGSCTQRATGEAETTERAAESNEFSATRRQM